MLISDFSFLVLLSVPNDVRAIESLELQAQLKRDHAGCAIAAQTNAE
jgi:hypothetical protein